MVYTKKFSEFNPGNVEQVVGVSGGNNTIGEGSGSGSGGVVITINQDTSGLFAGSWVRFDDATQEYTEALATTAEFAEVAGVVLEVLSGTQFKLQQSGYIEPGTAGFGGFSTSGTYFLNDLVAGEMTLTPPTDNGKIRLALFNADSANSGWICSLKTGMVIGSPGPIQTGGGGGSETSTAIVHKISQAGNGFAVGQWVRVSGDNVYSLASADSFANAQSVGVVIDDGDPVFTIQFSGINANSIINAVDAVGTTIPLVSGTVYYLSDVSAGKITPTRPTDSETSVVKPCYICESATNFTGYILPQQPIENNSSADDKTSIIVNQSTVGLTVENVMRVLASGTYTKALADTLPNSRAVGIITEIADANTFVLQTQGFSDKFIAKTPAVQYYLSATVPGLLTSTEPTTNGQVSKPMFQALTATSGYILNQRPMLQPNANGGVSVPSNIKSYYNPNYFHQGDMNPSLTMPAITLSNPLNRIKVTMDYIFISNTGSSPTVYMNRNSTQVTNFPNQTTSLDFIDVPGGVGPYVYTLNVYGQGNISVLYYGISWILEEIGPT